MAVVSIVLKDAERLRLDWPRKQGCLRYELWEHVVVRKSGAYADSAGCLRTRQCLVILKVPQSFSFVLPVAIGVVAFKQ